MTLAEAIQTAYELWQKGQLQEAESIYRQVLRQFPREINALGALGQVTYQTGRCEEAIELTQRAIEVTPSLPHLHAALAEMLFSMCRYKDAADAMQTAIKLAPGQASAHLNLALILYGARRFRDSAQECERAIHLDPRNPDIFNQLACAYLQLQRGDDAQRALESALAFDPGHTKARMNMAVALLLQGRLTEAVALNHHALDELPNYTDVATQFLIAIQNTDADPEVIAAEHVLWGKKFETRVTPQSSFPNSKDLNRILRIGYVSGDFRRHVVAHFLEPILAHHDRSKFQLFAYTTTGMADEITDRLRQDFDQWRDISQLRDADAARMISQDRIDILVDLAVHSACNRLGVFAHKPAPIQMTYLGYPGTTGLRSVDYRITAPHLDSPDLEEGPEELLSLPHSYFCYRQPDESPEVVDPPSLKNGFITFGSFNRAAKISDRCISLWSKVLSALPDSKLHLLAMEFSDPQAAQRTLDRFTAMGIAAKRIRILHPMDLDRYLAAYNDVDIGLDTFPVNGGATTLHALGMGVPVVSLMGRRSLSRLGLNILTALGLEDLVAGTPEDWIQRTCALAQDRSRLIELRRGMRKRLATSPIANAAQFTADLEALYRQAWQRWVHGPA